MDPIFTFPLFLSLMLSGLIMGLIFSLMGIGLTLVYSIMRLVNFAYGEFYMFGGYALYYASSLLGIPTILALPLAPLTGFCIGLLVERLLIQDTYTKKIERSEEYALIITFTLSIFFQNLARELFGPFLRTPSSFLPGRVHFLNFVITWDRVMAVIIAISGFALVYVFVKKTWIGRIWQAVAQNLPGALALGVNIKRTNALAFATSCMLASLAGALLAPIFSTYSSVGAVPLIKGFLIIVIGGLGSIKGSLVGGLIVGLIDSIVSGFISPAYASVALYIIMAGFLVIRPTGLLGGKVRRA
jgi:branched-chain amino acid transport system permease protein